MTWMTCQCPIPATIVPRRHFPARSMVRQGLAVHSVRDMDTAMNHAMDLARGLARLVHHPLMGRAIMARQDKVRPQARHLYGRSARKDRPRCSRRKRSRKSSTYSCS